MAPVSPDKVIRWLQRTPHCGRPDCWFCNSNWRSQ